MIVIMPFSNKKPSIKNKILYMIYLLHSYEFYAKLNVFFESPKTLIHYFHDFILFFIKTTVFVKKVFIDYCRMMI